jgi:virginiamycin B lyase
MRSSLSFHLLSSRRTRRRALALILACAAAIQSAGARAADLPPTITEYPLTTANAGPLAITAGLDNNLWVVENLTDMIARVTTTGSVTEFAVPITNANLSDLTTGPDQAVWFTALNAKQIGRITPAGQITTFPITGTIGGPSAITNGPGGLWFALPDDNAVGRMTLAGVVSTFIITTTNVDVRDLIVGPDGAIWASETSFDSNALARVDPTTGVVTEYALPDFIGTSQLAVTGGQIYFSVTQSNLIGRLNPANGAITSFPVPTADAQPSGITADSAGNVYFTETAGDAPGIGRVAPDGTVVEFTAPTPNASIQGITVGPDTNLWYAAFDASKVGRIAPTTASHAVYLPLIVH